MTEINPAVVKERRRLIRETASCEGCGSSLAACKAERGKDPTAPPWFGCCARGMAFAPCVHLPDPAQLSALLKEIEEGSVRTVAEVLAEENAARAARIARRRPIGSTPILDQGKWWRPKTGEWIRIADMADSHRRNTAAMLLRNATAYELHYSLRELSFLGEDAPDSVGDAMAESQARRMENPHRWMRGTVLYRALIAGLPDEVGSA